MSNTLKNKQCRVYKLRQTTLYIIVCNVIVDRLYLKTHVKTIIASVCQCIFTIHQSYHAFLRITVYFVL